MPASAESASRTLLFAGFSELQSTASSAHLHLTAQRPQWVAGASTRLIKKPKAASASTSTSTDAKATSASAKWSLAASDMADDGIGRGCAALFVSGSKAAQID